MSRMEQSSANLYLSWIGSDRPGVICISRYAWDWEAPEVFQLRTLVSAEATNVSLGQPKIICSLFHSSDKLDQLSPVPASIGQSPMYGPGYPHAPTAFISRSGPR